MKDSSLAPGRELGV